MSDFRPVTVRHEGVALQGQMISPKTAGPHPTVLVMHHALGLGEHEKETACRLADLGYVALAADMYGGGICPENLSEVGALMSDLLSKPEKLHSRVRSWYDALNTQPDVAADRVAAIGFCFGGRCVLDLARSGADVKAVVSYHGLLTTDRPAKAGAVKGVVSIYAGDKDPYAPRDHVEAVRNELTEAEARWQITVFGDTYHAFTDPRAAEMKDVKGVGYNPVADRLSWAGTLELLKATIG